MAVEFYEWFIVCKNNAFMKCKIGFIKKRGRLISKHEVDGP